MKKTYCNAFSQMQKARDLDKEIRLNLLKFDIHYE